MKKKVIPGDELRERAETLLENMVSARGIVDDLISEYNAAVEVLKSEFETKIAPWSDELAADEKELLALMKTGKKTLFLAGDVVDLPHGSLIRNLADKVTIPRTALAQCVALGLSEAIKVAKSLDREVVEKWPDDRLALIGATRKPAEEFKYHLKAPESDGVAVSQRGGSR